MKLSLKNVQYKIKNKAIIDKVSLDFSDMQLTGLIGPNGSGKTTLLRLIMGTIFPNSGSVEIDGRAAALYTRRELARKIAILCQNTFSDFAFPCGEVVLMGRHPYRSRFQPLWAEDFQIAEEMMNLTSTISFKERLITELSGGEEQSVFLARALTQTPQFLLLDEPTSHLDIYHQIKILELVKSLSKKIGIVLVIHDLNMAARFCDRLVLMSKGEIVAQGAPPDILTSANIQSVFNVHCEIRQDPILNAIQLVFLQDKNLKSENPKELHYV